MSKLQLKLKGIPNDPGVYFFLGKNKKILYIGKATSLKNRVRSYFSEEIKEKRSELIAKMVEEALDIEFTVTDSVLEALILETNLIRTHKPYYNTRSKDDKSYNYLIITNEEWPRVLIVRAKDLSESYTESEIKYKFGPFTNGALFREAMKIVRRLFKFYDTKIPVGTERSKMARGKIDFNRQIGLYPNNDNKAEYLKTIRQLKLFFQGKKQQIIKELQKEMASLAKKEEFEKANFVKKKIFALQHIEDISLIKEEFRNLNHFNKIRIEAYDVAHYRGQSMVGVMTVIENGEANKSEYRKFKIKTLQNANDPAALRELLMRRFSHTEWMLPQIIVVDGGVAQKNIAEKTLAELIQNIEVVAVVKDERHKVAKILASADTLNKYKLEILLANAESHRFAINYYRNLARKKQLE